MATPDVSALTSAFVERGPSIFQKNVLNWDLRNQGVQVRTNVNAPQAMTKISTVGAVRPYSAADATLTGPKFTDRVLTAYQTKFDFDFDPEQFRNTYLASDPGMPFYEAAINAASNQILNDIQLSALYAGTRNAAGTTAADLCDGWGKLIADLITATTLTPVVTGAITSANAVAKFELMIAALPAWLRQRGGVIKCSYTQFDNYRYNYRSTYGFTFNPQADGRYKMDNVNFYLQPQAFMNASGRIIATTEDNLVFGTDAERVAMFASQRRNIIEVRLMMPVGVNIQDTDAIFVNDQA